METNVARESNEKSDSRVKSKNAPKPTKTSHFQTYSSRKKSEKQVSTSLKSLTATDIVASCCQRVGIKSLDSETALQLAEDAEHRLRELIELSKQFMLHSNRTKLLVKDIARASSHSNAEVDTIPFSVSHLESTEDMEVDLEGVLAKEDRFNTTKEGTVGCSWLVLENSVLDSKKNRGTQVSVIVQGKSGKNKDLHLFISSIFTEDNETREYALSQLATAAWISNVLVEIVHALCDVIKNEGAGTHRLIALEAIKCISSNKKLFIEVYLVMLTTSLRSLLFIEKPSHFRPKRELLQRNALSCLIRLLRERTTPYNGLEGQLDREATRLINNCKTHPVNLYGALLVALNTGGEIIEDCVIPKLDVIYENSIQNLTGKPTQYSQYLSLLIIQTLSEAAALYLTNTVEKCSTANFYLASLEKFSEVFLMQCMSYQYRGPYVKLIGKKKHTHAYTGVGKMDEKELEKLMYLTNLPTPEESSPHPKYSLQTVNNNNNIHHVFKEGEKIKFKIQTKQVRVSVVGVDIENMKHNPSGVQMNFKTRAITPSQLNISCDLRTIF